MERGDRRSSWMHPVYPVVSSLAVIVISVASSFWMSPQNTRERDLAQRRTGPIPQQRTVEDLPEPLALFETVFWEPRDTESLRRRIRESNQVRGKSVLEIGTGTGLLSLCCLQAGAEHVVATDVNPSAVVNARHNAERFDFTERLAVRLVSTNDSGAFAVIGEDEQFDLIISNPPWENGIPKKISEHALYDPGFQLLNSLLVSARLHLKPGGRIWLAYGSVDGIQQVQLLASRYRWELHWLDDRKLADLPPVFLPGLLLELVPSEK